MNTNDDDGDYSDNEIFFGKMTLTEVKKRIVTDYHPPILSCTTTEMKYSGSSVKLNKICSEPESKSIISLDDSNSSLCSSSKNKITNSCYITSDDESFLEKERMVSELLLADKKGKEDLDNKDNTLNVIEHILHNAPSTEHCHKVNYDIEKTRNDHSENNLQETEINPRRSQSPKEMLEVTNVKCSLNTDWTIPFKEEHLINNFNSALTVNRSFSKRINNIQKNIYQSSPSINVKQTCSLFKTPKAASLLNKNIQTPKNIHRLNSYKHIASPVATYIKNGLQVPLLKNVRPITKPLSGTSLIPKSIKSSEKKTNKENINLPSVAYKNAKCVKVIKMPDMERLPESLIMKDNHRENNSSKKSSIPQSANSFANLTLNQS